VDEKDVTERLVKVETKIEEHQRLFNAQSEKNDTLTRLTILMERQQEESKEFKASLNKFNDTLQNVNENLTNLNINQQQMKIDMNEIGNRVEEIEKKSDEHKIDPMKVVLKILGFVGTLVGGAIATFLYMKLGLK
jgi:cytochrome c556